VVRAVLSRLQRFEGQTHARVGVRVLGETTTSGA
jgi:hypothetical protein